MAHEAETLLTAEQVAEILLVSVDTVKRWVKSKELIGLRTPGGHWRFPRSAVDDLIQRGYDRDWPPKDAA